MVATCEMETDGEVNNNQFKLILYHFICATKMRLLGSLDCERRPTNLLGK